MPWLSSKVQVVALARAGAPTRQHGMVWRRCDGLGAHLLTQGLSQGGLLARQRPERPQLNCGVAVLVAPWRTTLERRGRGQLGKSLAVTGRLRVASRGLRD